MTLLFMNAIVAGDWEQFKIKCIPFLVCITCDTIAMVVDLISGVRKAYKRGDVRTSTGYKRTVDKALKYYSLLILCFLIDVIASMVVTVPYFTMAAGIAIVVIEVISWYEKADKKEKRDINIMANILANKDDIVKAVASEITKNIKDETNP